MLTSTDTVLVLGTDQRPKGSKEPGADTSDKGSRSDTIMLWRIGGGISRRLSIPRDTVRQHPRLRAVEDQRRLRLRRTGAGDQDGRAVHRGQDQPPDRRQPGQLPEVHRRDRRGRRQDRADLLDRSAAGPRTAASRCSCSPGTHHLNGIQALTLARTRENACNAASNDLTREGYQQKILNCDQVQAAVAADLLPPAVGLLVRAADAPHRHGRLHAAEPVRGRRDRRLGADRRSSSRAAPRRCPTARMRWWLHPRLCTTRCRS